MKLILASVHAFLYMATLALSYSYYVNVGVEAPEWLYYLVFFAVIGVSVLIALGHIVGGGLMGLTGGGVWDGMRLGLTLGLGTALGRLWPYLAIITFVAFLAKGPTWHWVLAGIGAVLCLGVHYLMSFIWAKVA